jgi:RNA polymerase sigma-70 factor, ECF subfamily
MGNERQQFEELFLPFLDAAYNLARWIIRNEHDAEDVVQEAYLRAFKGFPGFRGDNAKAWLLTIVRNTAYTWLSKRGLEENLVPYEEEKHADIILFDRAAAEMASEQRKEELRNALERLPAEFRDIIVLYEFDGLSYKELASALGVAIGTVMSRLSRARRRLQEEISRRQSGEAVNEL